MAQYKNPISHSALKHSPKIQRICTSLARYIRYYITDLNLIQLQLNKLEAIKHMGENITKGRLQATIGSYLRRRSLSQLYLLESPYSAQPAKRISNRYELSKLSRCK